MNKADFNYIAGFFDGEGSVFLTHRMEWRSRCRISIAQKDPTILLWIQEEFGGRMVQKRHRGDGSWQLILHREREVRHFAETIGPLTKRSRRRLYVAAQIARTRGSERAAWREKFPSNHKEAKVGSKA